jgi:hypothetical protein
MMTTDRTTRPLTPDVQRGASRYLHFNGREVLRGVGFLRGTKITCPAGHAVKPDTVILGDGVLFCDNRPAKGHAPCGALIYLLMIPARGDAAHRIWLADCTREELRDIERRGLDAAGIQAYFGAAFPR